MTATLFQQSLVRAVDDNGNPISGAKMYFYTTGTTTAATWYLDDGVTPGTNPHTSDAAGQFDPAFLDDGIIYRVVLKTAAGATIWDADPVGSELQVFTAAGTGAVSRQISSKLQDEVSVLDFIPENLHAAIKARTSTTDVSAYVQTAIDAINTATGGTLRVPAGRYYCAAEIDLCKHIVVQGDGKLASTFYFTSDNGFRSTWTINASTAVHISLRDIGIQAPTTNTGIGFWEQGGTFVVVQNCLFRAWKWHIAFDQTELAEIDLCDFEYDNTVATALTQGAAAVWLVSGTELNPSAAGAFTNRISITRCQFNGANTFAAALRDDGGVTHAIRDNNWNGFGRHIHMAGVTSGLIEGGEHEGVAINNDQIVLSNLSQAGAAKGQPTNVSMCDLFSGTNGTSYHVNVVSCAQLTIERCYFSSGSTNGAINVAGLAVLQEQSNYHAHGYPIYYGNPSSVSSLGRLGGLLTTGAIGYTANTGGTVTQATDKSTGVTLNKLTGAITMNGAALATITAVSFTLTNSTIAAADVVLVSIKSGATAGAYSVEVDAVAAGSCQISLRNNTAGSLSEAVVLNYAVIKGSAS
jgi:hypothetical protein